MLGVVRQGVLNSDLSTTAQDDLLAQLEREKQKLRFSRPRLKSLHRRSV